MTKQEAIARLHELLKPGATVYTMPRHVSRSGMKRCISLMIVDNDGDIISLDYWASRAGLGRIDNNHGGIVVNGCGMDMGLDLVYRLGRTLWPDGHGGRDGGYSLKHVWL